jgi:hypothetical protein
LIQQQVEQKPVTPTLPQRDSKKFKNAQGCPTYDAYIFWIDNVRDFDEFGEVKERFMDWFRRAVI